MKALNLPPPNAIEPLDYETLLANRKARFLALHQEENRHYWEKRLALESEPVVKLLEENAYLEMLLRERINQAVKACLLPFATGADLDNLADFYAVKREIIQHADPDAKPPKPQILESDDRLRERLRLSFSMLNTAGSKNSYRAHALKVDPLIHDAYIHSPAGGRVDVYLLFDRNLSPEQRTALVRKTTRELSDDEVRPLCDLVTVKEVEPLTYRVQAKIALFRFEEKDKIQQQATQRLNDFVKHARTFGYDITPSAIIATLSVDGVQNVDLQSPTEILHVSPSQAAECSAISLSFTELEQYD